MAKKGDTSKWGSVFQNEGLSLKAFLSLMAVMDHGSMSAAANVLNSNFKTVSKHLSELEDFFGCKLRSAKGKTAELTDEGRNLALIARRHIHEIQEFKDQRKNSLSAVSVGGGDSLLHGVVLPKLHQIQGQYPNTSITVLEGGTFDLFQQVQNFSVDLALLREESIQKKQKAPQKTRAKSAGEETLAYVPLGEYGYSVVFSRSMIPPNVMPDERAAFNLPFALIKSHWNRDFVSLAKKNGISINVKVWCDNFSFVFRLVRLGHFAGILPTFTRTLLPPQQFVIQPASFLQGKDTIVLAWNTRLLEIRKNTLKPFVDSFASILKF